MVMHRLEPTTVVGLFERKKVLIPITFCNYMDTWVYKKQLDNRHHEPWILNTANTCQLIAKLDPNPEPHSGLPSNSAHQDIQTNKLLTPL